MKAGGQMTTVQVIEKMGGREGIRTPALLLAKQVLALIQFNSPTGFGPSTRQHIVSDFFGLQMAYESSTL
jgi:hypothetical protein